MRGEGNHKIPGSFAPENMEKTGAERVKYSLACQHEDAIPIKFVSYAQKCPTVLCTFAVALRKESVDRNPKQDGNWGWGEEITPITEDDAREWAEKYLDGNTYEAAFGEVVEDARLNVLLPQELLDKLDARVTAGGGNRSEVVRAALRAYLEG